MSIAREIRIPYQINVGGLVALLPDGRVEFLDHAARALVDDFNAGVLASDDFVIDNYVLSDPLVDLDNFHLTAPAIAFIETTNLCNLRCKHCYADSGHRRPREMPTQKIMELIDEFDRLGVLQVFLTGGEVFAHPDCLSIIAHAKSKRFSTQIFTNGLLITPEKLRALPAGTSFFVSFDTADPVRSIRGRMDFPRLRECFDAMAECGHVVRTAVSVHRYNIDDVEEIFAWCAEYGYPRPQWLETHPIGRALLHPDILLTPDQIERVFAIYRRCMDRFSSSPDLPSDAEGIDHDLGSKTRSIDTIKFCQRLEQATRREKCARALVYVNSAGDVFPCSNCMSAGMFRGGNIIERSFAEIWRHEFRDIRAITFEDFEVCRACPVEHEGFWCQFKCPPLAKHVSGHPLGCGATDYLRQFLLQAGRYWEGRQRQGIKLTMSAQARPSAGSSA